jgi:hypothetical protein
MQGGPKKTTIILPILPRAILLILSLPGFASFDDFGGVSVGS